MFFLTSVVPTENGMLKLTVQDVYNRARTRVVRPDRRFLIASRS